MMRPGGAVPDGTGALGRVSAKTRQGAVPGNAGARGATLRGTFQLKRGFGSR